MKKKCRVYKPKSMQDGGATYNSQVTMTQDSTKDPIYKEKANNFVQWLHNNHYNPTNPPMVKAQNGISYPGQPEWNAQDEFHGLTPRDDFDYSTLQVSENDYQVAPGQQMYEFEPGGPDDPFKKDKRTSDKIFMGYPTPEGMAEASQWVAGLQIAGNILDTPNRLDRENQLKRQFSDVYNFNDVTGSDRGDYMANVPGVGDFFRPDDHTRMGYNTKIAQDGGEPNPYTQRPDDGWFHPFDFGDYNRPKSPMEKNSFYNYMQDEMRELNALQAFDYGTSPTQFLASMGVQDMQDYLKEVKQRKKEYLSGIKDRAKDWISQPGNKEAYLDYKKGMGIKEQGGQLNVDDEITLTEEQINNLIKQGYNLEYLD